jgi:hypothetical protein
MPADEGLHEIQLNGKQLVFLFMASTVVAVVIFLCGVMVGRGVRAQRPALETAVEAATDPTSGATSDVPLPPATAVTSNAPIAAQETLTYPSRLDGQEHVEERLRPGSGIRDQGSGSGDQGSGIREECADRGCETGRCEKRTAQTGHASCDCGNSLCNRLERTSGQRIRRSGSGGQRPA